ncbi:uncharacterized protein LOC122386359 [Amphibalanus amphitrite]|uniref:uncharacterized protein LOC122386359 n=1 Tax=Amphibalanus amphitrite TaxID=1232801 RepID=UPI001C90E669|nr:uncharacterized protein LOC122386359 [Amphibalanus amphitrite]
MQYVKLLPHKVMRRYLLVVVVWTLCCYAVYRFTGIESHRRYLASNVNTRQILQNMLETTTVPVPLQKLLELRPLIDTSPALSEKEVLNSMRRDVPNLPVDYWLAMKGKATQKNKTCAKLPAVYDLKFNNIYWQVLETSNGTYNFYAAYYDNRPTLSIGPLVRIMVMIDRIKPTLKTYCQMWFSGQTAPVIMPVMEYKYVWNEKWGNFKQGIIQPYLMACQVPASHRKLVPQAVTVVESPCNTSTVALRVINNRPPEGQPPQDFAVCVKGLSFPDNDLSVRLVEWLETLRVLGAKKVFLYDLEVHPNISKVLRYYERQGLVEVTPLTLAGEQPNLSVLQRLYLRKKVTNKRQSELVPYNDCFYRNLYRYKYVALLDTDEVIMPTGHRDWAELMASIAPRADTEAKKKNKVVASYNARNVYFFDVQDHEHTWQPDIPHYMHMLQHVKRSLNYTKPGHYIKCFHRTDRVIALHNHFPLACLGGCLSYSINTSDAQLQHYRADCVGPLRKTCELEYKKNAVVDTSIWRFKEELITRSTRTLVTLGFLPPEGGRLAELYESARSAHAGRAESLSAQSAPDAATEAQSEADVR